MFLFNFLLHGYKSLALCIGDELSNAPTTLRSNLTMYLALSESQNDQLSNLQTTLDLLRSFRVIISIVSGTDCTISHVKLDAISFVGTTPIR